MKQRRIELSRGHSPTQNSYPVSIAPPLPPADLDDEDERGGEGSLVMRNLARFGHQGPPPPKSPSPGKRAATPPPGPIVPEAEKWPKLRPNPASSSLLPNPTSLPPPSPDFRASRAPPWAKGELTIEPPSKEPTTEPCRSSVPVRSERSNGEVIMERVVGYGSKR